jgi:uncharacterized protein YecT (DUF1311 family)
MKQYNLIGLAIACCFCLPSQAAAFNDPWTDANGAHEAALVIVECLAIVGPEGPSLTREQCIRAPLDACSNRHATNEMTLAECTKFTRDAWNARLTKEENRARAAGPVVARALEKSEAQYRAWSDADCAVQTGDDGGNYNAEQQNICVFTHTAWRALELETLADLWEGHPPSAPKVR